MERLPSYQELKSEFSLTALQQSFIKQSRQTICHILNGTDPRLLLIVGPCSIHDMTSALEFATQLKRLSSLVSSHFLLVMRVYCEKARTSAGWKGFLYDPFLNGSHDIQTGLKWTRQLLLQLADLQVPAATEFLDPVTALYYDDLISWGSIGARTSYAQTHRQFASGLSMPLGIKNCISGQIASAIHGVTVATRPQTYIGLDETGCLSTIRTKGNQEAHIVLRGGERGPNYDEYTINEALACLKAISLPPRLLIDCSHENSGKRYDQQPIVFQSILHQIIKGNTYIRGLLLESHLFAGSQPLLHPTQLQYGISITDACLDWSSTEQLIQWGCHHLSQQRDAAIEDFSVLATK